VGLALTASACGDGSSNSSSTAVTGASSDSDAQAVLASIRTDVGDQGPQKLKLSLTATASGTAKDPTLGVFLGKPITLDLEGPVDAGARKADLSYELAAGPIKVDGGLRQVGSSSFLEVNGTWYTLPANTLSGASGTGTTGTTGTSLSPQALLRAFGDPKALLRNAKLDGSDDVGGVDSDHVTGDVDLTALAKVLAAVSGGTGTGTGTGSPASPLSPAQIAQSVRSLQQDVRSATADLWVGKDDHQIHRFATTIEGVLDDTARSSSGIEGFKIELDVSATPTSSPSVSAPAGAAPIAQLEQDLGGLLGGLGSTGGTTG
jgi:hypothetical protein